MNRPAERWGGGVPGTGGAVRHYSLLGSVLRSEFPFPELPEVAPADPAWEFRVDRGSAPPAGPLRGEREVVPGWTLRLMDLEDGWRFTFGELGCFDLARDGRRCTWYPGAKPNDELARSVMAGPIASLSLQKRGWLCLHGSAVATAEGVIGFLAPKHHGKSTLALAMTLAGARLVTDDLVAVDPRPAPEVRPGVHHLRLIVQSLDDLPWDVPGTLLPGGKATLAELPPRFLQRTRAPLAALYLLRPAGEEPAESPDEPGGAQREDDAAAAPCWRERVPPGEAVAALGHQAKLPFSLVGPAWARGHFQRSAHVVREVPVSVLHFRTGLDVLPEVASTILGWHGGAPDADGVDS